ncbi:hypothetical protein [Clostridium sp. 'White wine YQ']|uniref:hypothetical protein n=1 Tax=Clostridium sp. 'White wine YQ' TaxID=3027474 RepID=UPI0023666335|nr:hypothetical protein [Clostridium sp. 'White wine YQ']MDD7796081.1 hypothetical protein [Clostridium sp. 'White wine YQ']
MESYEDKTLGGGIIAVVVIQLFFSALSIILLTSTYLLKDQIDQIAGAEQVAKITFGQVSLTAILVLVIITGIIFILFKKAIGIFLYFASVTLNTIYSLILNGFNLSILISLILPILMGVFINQKKELFGIGVKGNNINI